MMPYIGSKAWFASSGLGRYFPISWEGWLSLAICIALLVLLRKFEPVQIRVNFGTFLVIGTMLLVLLAKTG